MLRHTQDKNKTIMEKTFENKVFNTDDTLISIYAAYGSGSGILFGITNKQVVREIIDFTIRRMKRKMEEGIIEDPNDIEDVF